MAKRKAPAWAGFPQGAALSLLLYILLQCFAAFLTIWGVLPETAVFRVQVGSGGVAAFAGGLLAIRRTGVGTLLAALGSAAGFVVLLFLGGTLAWDGVVWSAESALLLSGALAGGLAAGVLGGRKKKRKPAPAVRRERAGKRAL